MFRLTLPRWQDEQATTFHCRRIHALQKAAFKLFPDDLRPLTMSNIGAVQARSSLVRHLTALSPEQLRQLAEHLHLLHPLPKGADGRSTVSPNTVAFHLFLPTTFIRGTVESREFLSEVLLTYHELRPSQLEKVNELALYPNEDILWDENAVPSSNYTGSYRVSSTHAILLPHDVTIHRCRRALPGAAEAESSISYLLRLSPAQFPSFPPGGYICDTC